MAREGSKSRKFSETLKAQVVVSVFVFCCLCFVAICWMNLCDVHNSSQSKMQSETKGTLCVCVCVPVLACVAGCTSVHKCEVVTNGKLASVNEQ